MKPIPYGSKYSTRQGDLWIEKTPERLILRFDPVAIQSEIDRAAPQRLLMKNLQYQMGILLFMPPPKSILLRGVGGGALLHFLHHHYPDSHITGVDYDAELLELMQAHFMLPRADDKLIYVIDDARRFIEHDPNRYDLILVDIFDGSQSPKWLLSPGFTQQLQARLSAKGALAYNLLIDGERAFSKFYPIVRRTFQQQALCLETDEYENILVYALNFTQAPRSLMDNLESAQALGERIELPFGEILSKVYDINPQGGGII